MTNEMNEKIAVQIDLKLLNRYNDELEDLLDGIIAASKKEEERVPLDRVIRDLKKAGKLK